VARADSCCPLRDAAHAAPGCAASVMPRMPQRTLVHEDSPEDATKKRSSSAARRLRARRRWGIV